MPRINLEDSWFVDPRREALKEKIGLAVDTIAISFWRLAQSSIRQGVILKTELFEMMPHWKEFEAVGLAKRMEEGVYICGSNDHLSWLENKVKAGRLGGLAKASNCQNLPEVAKQTLPSSSSSSSSSISKRKKIHAEAKHKVSPEAYFLSVNGKIEEWEKAFPLVDIKAEIEKMKAWFFANPARKKSNYDRFVVNWLNNAIPGNKKQLAGPLGPPLKKGEL